MQWRRTFVCTSSSAWSDNPNSLCSSMCSTMVFSLIRFNRCILYCISQSQRSRPVRPPPRPPLELCTVCCFPRAPRFTLCMVYGCARVCYVAFVVALLSVHAGSAAHAPSDSDSSAPTATVRPSIRPSALQFCIA